MAVHIVQLGTPRAQGEGLRLGTVRRPPRGVRKAEFARRNYYDIWLPELAPSTRQVSWAHETPFTDKRWTVYGRNYRREMRKTCHKHMIQLLAGLSHETDFSVGCYCENEERCHRSLLRELLAQEGADIAGRKN
jgi:uncharacterized protein YeaO (DUF488 family)